MQKDTAYWFSKINLYRYINHHAEFSPRICIIERLAVMDLDSGYGADQDLAEALPVEIRNVIYNFYGYEVLVKKDVVAIAQRMEAQYASGYVKSLRCLIDFGNPANEDFQKESRDLNESFNTCFVAIVLRNTD